MVFILPLIAVGAAGVGAWLLGKKVTEAKETVGEHSEAIGNGIIGAGLVGGGVLLTKIVPPMLPKNKKKYGYLPGLATALGGTYFLYRAFVPGKGEETEKKTVGDIKEEGLRFPVTIIKPREYEMYGMVGEKDFTVQVQNPQDKKYTLYVGLSMKYEKATDPYDYPAKEITIPAKGAIEYTWKYNFQRQHLGRWEVISRTWNRYPYLGCIEEGNCVILGDTGWRPFGIKLWL